MGLQTVGLCYAQPLNNGILTASEYSFETNPFCHASRKGSLTLAMDKCLWFSVKIKVCQSSRSSPRSYPDLSTLWL